MTLERPNIPVFFWYSLSVCMLLATAVLLIIAYRSSSISIEVASAKINLSSAIESVKDAKQQLEEQNAILQEKYKKLHEEYSSLVEKMNDDKKQETKIPVPGGDVNSDMFQGKRGIPLDEMRKMREKIAALALEGTISSQFSDQLKNLDSKIARAERDVAKIN
ncbi:MAG: hypothetical protein GYA47_10185 [Desulfovibrio sp.]|nr:hypothetical protein [Desulfovibrio sp.]